MTERFLFGRHPLDGSYGLWLSKPGIGVRDTVDPNNMLICPYKKNEQCLMSSKTSVGPGADITVYYPENFSTIPYVQFMCTGAAGMLMYPESRGPFGASNTVYVTQYTNAAVFQNRTTASIDIYYNVFARAT